MAEILDWTGRIRIRYLNVQNDSVIVIFPNLESLQPKSLILKKI